MIEKIINTIKELELCDDDDFFYFLITHLQIVSDTSVRLTGIYEEQNNTVVVIPFVDDNLTMAIALNEIGKLYALYKKIPLDEARDISLKWEFRFLYNEKEYNLLEHRLSEEIDDPKELKYRTVIKKEIK